MTVVTRRYTYIHSVGNPLPRSAPHHREQHRCFADRAHR